ncbi:MAG: HEAT repeat domain-containing protein, partial [Planctomycetes bacterium]|nr:HEAT repeat domain-containing protein [Planctomycetota bacterium]
MSATLTAFLLAAVLGHAGVGGAADGQELERWLSALDSAREPEWSEALARLSALGEPAALRALADFEKADFPARRARARLLAEIPSASHCARLLELVRDPDPEVRRLLAEALGSTALAGAAGAERVQELERLMLADVNARVRAQALEALVESTLSEAVPV